MTVLSLEVQIIVISAATKQLRVLEREVPSAWTCSPTSYNNLDGCDCGCGILDPGCLIRNYNMMAFGFKSYEYCDMGGVCQLKVGHVTLHTMVQKMVVIVAVVL